MDVPETTCLNCEAPLPPERRKYCGAPDCRRAQKRHSNERAAVRRLERIAAGQIAICRMEQCDKYVYALDLCKAHYLRTLPLERRHKRITTVCGVCGVEVTKYADNRFPVRFCSLKCRDVWVSAHPWRRPKSKAVEVHSNPWTVWGWCDLPVQTQPKDDPRPRFVAGCCPMCGAGFVADRFAYDNGTSRYCSSRCTRAAAGDRRRARQHSAYVADVYRRRVFERDGWRCQLCRRKVSKTARVPDPKAATIDHIIPLALGGTHEPVNCQTACFECNCRKAHVGVGDQLRLIA